MRDHPTNHTHTRGCSKKYIHQKSSRTLYSSKDAEIMTTVSDFAPFIGTIGGGFFGGMLAGYAIKKIMR